MTSSFARRRWRSSAKLLVCIGITLTGCITRAEPKSSIDQGARFAKPLGPIEWLAHSDRFRPIAPDDRYPRVPDSWLTWRIEGILSRPELQTSEVEVVVERQNVVLTGRVRLAEDKKHLIEAIKGINGVAHIEDMLRIEP